LIVEQFSSLEVKKKLQTPLLRERIEHLTQSVKSVLGEGLSRRVCHTVLDTVSHGFAVEEFSSLEVEQNLQTTPLLWERIEHLTQSVKSVLGEGSSRREQNNYPLTLALSRRERGLLDSRNNFPLSIFNFPFIKQPTTKEVLC